MNVYAIKYTTHRMRGYKIYFGKGKLVQHAIDKLRKTEPGIRVLGFSKRPTYV